MRPSLSAFASRPNPLSMALTISILGSRESFQEKRPLDSVAARASGRTAQIGQVGTLGIDGRSRLLLAYFRHTEPESGANGNATCRLTDSQSALLQISWVHPLIGPQRAFEPFASLLLE